MANVISTDVVRIHDVEGSLTSVSIGGGAGAAANTDIFIQGAQSLGRRQSNVTLGGFYLDDGVSNNLSAAGVHVGLWAWHTHYSVLTDFRVRLGDNGNSNNYYEHTVPLSEYPSLGGWIRVWIDMARTAETTGGAGLTTSTTRYFGLVNSLPSVGGNAANLILDAIDYTTHGLGLTGTAGSFDDFVTADEDNSTNKYGIITTLSDVIYCKGRLVLGGSAYTPGLLTFTDSNFTMVFPQQNLVANDFMGVRVLLGNASTDISLSSCSFSSPGVKRGDFIVSGSVGTLGLDGVTFSAMREIVLTSATTVANSAFLQCGVVTHGNATIDSSTFSSTKVNTNNPSFIEGCSFISTGGHGMEILTTGTFNLTNVTWAGFGASGTTDAAIYNNSSGAVTLNIIGGTTPTYRNGTSASTAIVANPSTLTLSNVVSGSEVRIYTAGTTGELYGIETTDGVTNPAYTYTETGFVDIVVHNIDYQYYRIEGYPLQNSDATLPIAQVFDRNYSNP